MRFNNLTKEEQLKLYTELTQYSEMLGGVNAFLSTLEEIKEEKPKPLLNKTAIYHTSKAKFTWEKAIYKDTLTLIYNAMANEEKNGNIFTELNQTDYKKTMNMIRTIKPIQITVISKESSTSFSFNILNTEVEKNTKFSLLFKIFFFYNPSFAKEVLQYKAEVL